MATHYIPRELKGETKILYIFSTRALITTGVVGAVGLILFLIFSALNLKVVGIILFAFFAFLGYAVGTFKIPQITGLKFTKNIAGDSIDEIVIRFFKFNMNKKVYSYTKEDE